MVERYKSVFSEQTNKVFKFNGRNFVYHEEDGVVVFCEAVNLYNLNLFSLTEFSSKFDNRPYACKLFFDCSANLIKDLKGAPEETLGSFNCTVCDSLLSLEGAPKYVGNNFNCYDCKSLSSLKGAPEILQGRFNCERCPSLPFTALSELKNKKIGQGLSEGQNIIISDYGDFQSVKQLSKPIWPKEFGKV